MIYFDQTSKRTELTPGLVVSAYNILTTRTWVCVLLQKTENFGPFSSLFTIREDEAEGVSLPGVYGEYTTARLPLDVDALRPMSAERYAACDAWRAQREEEAYSAIIATYPEFANGRKSMGQIEIECAPDHCSCREGRIIPQPCPLHG